MKNQKSQLKSQKTVREILQSIYTYIEKKRGMTLVEVIISLALFSILAIPVSVFVNTSLNMNKKSEIKQQASLLGQDILEELGILTQLYIGENKDLFDLTSVLVEDSTTCISGLYCIKEMQINDFIVNLELNKLNENSTDLYKVDVEVELNNVIVFNGMRVVSLAIKD